MKEKPILFSGEMVRAILAGRKTQTRRVMNPQPDLKWRYTGTVPCPYGEKGDCLWVRETWAVTEYFDDMKPSDFLWIADEYEYPDGYIFYRADGEITNNPQFTKWRPSIFMPRAFSRINLEIISVRAERLQDIADIAAIEEGINRIMYELSPRDKFKHLWNSINAKRGCSWASNPWVWVVEFRKITNA